MKRGRSGGAAIRTPTRRERDRRRPQGVASLERVQAMAAEKVVRAMPDIAAAQAAYDRQEWDEAERLIRKIIDVHDLQNPMTYDAWASCAQFQGRMDLAIQCYRKALQSDPTYRVAHDRLIMILDALPDTTPEKAQRERTRWWERFGKDHYARRRPHLNNRDPERPIKIGYLSGDYQYHSAATVFHRIVMHHSEGYIPYLYSSTPTKYLETDSITHGFMMHPNWRQLVDPRPSVVPGMPNEDVPWPDWLVCEKILRDEIDILVDLSGYTANNRLPVFCMKPCPIQITGWGYATGVGWPAMDYLVTDRVVLPEDHRDDVFEEPLYLASIIDYEPTQGLPEANPLPCLTERPTFGVFQRSLKINPTCIEVWRQILERLPESRLIFKSHYCETFKAWVLEHFKDQAHQVEFQPVTSSYAHKVAYEQVDLNLDPWPQTAGVSGCDALWQGVPMVTLIGERIIQRTSASLLTTLGLTDFITATEADYVDAAVSWVTERKQELAAIRASLRARCDASPIRQGYLESVEAEYRRVWRQWCDTPLSLADARYRLEAAS